MTGENGLSLAGDCSSPTDHNRFVRLEERWVSQLLKMLASVDYRLFHPHPFSRKAICRLLTSSDEYWLLLNDYSVIGYGMLRGWEEGYAVPSLGIAVDAKQRGKGFGEKLMRFLHARAIARGATRVRLTVAVENVSARALYKKLGYREAADGAWFFDLEKQPKSTDGVI